VSQKINLERYHALSSQLIFSLNSFSSLVHTHVPLVLPHSPTGLLAGNARSVSERSAPVAMLTLKTLLAFVVGAVPLEVNTSAHEAHHALDDSVSMMCCVPQVHGGRIGA
jgi:hypothetical protein